VHKWKRFLPDGGAFVKGGFRKKTVRVDPDGLSRYLTESCRGELTHWLAILPFWIFGFFLPGKLIWLMLSYAIVVNIPCIVVLRYNRPRVSGILAVRNREDTSEIQS
jgi:glycosyl-4,4'-diaponeurosporenoate acyltransferase